MDKSIGPHLLIFDFFLFLVPLAVMYKIMCQSLYKHVNLKTLRDRILPSQQVSPLLGIPTAGGIIIKWKHLTSCVH